MTRARTALLLFAAFAALYQLTFGTLPFHIPDYPTWAFFADSREGMLRAIPSISNDVSIAKHPMYILVGRPLFWLALAIYGAVSAPLDVNLAITLPSAIMGGGGVAIAYWVFRENRDDRGEALGFALLYGLGTAPWVFGSFPDTYVFTAFFTILYVGVLLKIDPEEPKHIFLLAAANALACWSSPQQLLLAVLPGMYWLLRHGIGAHLIRRVVQYSLALAATWVLPYYIWLYFLGPGWRMPHQYMKENVEFSLGFIATVPLDFTIFNVVGPTTQPNLYTDPTLAVFGAAPLWWWPILAVYLVFVVLCVRHWRTSNAKGAAFLPGIVVFMIGYAIFFMMFNAPESYLMALTCTFIWLFGLHSARVAAGPPVLRRFLLPALVALACISNFTLIRSLRAEAIAKPLGIVPTDH